MEFTVYKGNWRRASQRVEEAGPTRLLNDYGQMCCLGHVCNDLGMSLSTLKGRTAPDTILYADDQRKIRPLLKKDFSCNELSCKAIGINDDTEMSDNTREKKLRALFKEHGHTIHFVKGIRPGVNVNEL